LSSLSASVVTRPSSMQCKPFSRFRACVCARERAGEQARASR
jgi:hypothetical protein